MNERTRPALRLLLAAAAAGLLAVLAAADVVVLKDGRRIEGNVTSRTATEVVVETPFGELRFPRAEVVEIIEQKTRDEIYEEKLAAAETAHDFFELAEWCVENRLKQRSRKHYEKAIELDPGHKGARLALGYVLYDGEWMTPEERDRRIAADRKADMEARGLVQHEGRWVTPDEKRKLEAGLVEYEGRWIPEVEAMAKRGLVLHEGEWIPREQAAARQVVGGAVEAAARPLEVRVGEQALLIGTVGEETLKEIDAGLVKARAWFDGAWGVQPGLDLFGGHLAEFYVFDADEPYRLTVPWLAGRSSFVPEGWVEAVQGAHGFTWTDPLAISSARQWNRGLADLVAHCYHHMGHLMLGRLQYKGKLLPAWYEEGVASLTELRVHGHNAVFCRSSFSELQGSASSTGTVEIDSRLMRDGSWRRVLSDALAQGRVEPFDSLARREFSQLELVHIAISIAIVEWLESRGEGTLARFHAALRKGAPPAPYRVIQSGRERYAYYDRAFGDAVGMGFKQADAEWRRWFRSR